MNQCGLAGVLMGKVLDRAEKGREQGIGNRE
jgi:hypothetical protein